MWNGTRINSPNLQLVVYRVVRVVPDVLERGLDAGVGGAGQLLCVGARAQEINEVLHFRDSLGRQSLEIVEEDLLARAVHELISIE